MWKGGAEHRTIPLLAGVGWIRLRRRTLQRNDPYFCSSVWRAKIRVAPSYSLRFSTALSYILPLFDKARHPKCKQSVVNLVLLYFWKIAYKKNIDKWQEGDKPTPMRSRCPSSIGKHCGKRLAYTNTYAPIGGHFFSASFYCSCPASCSCCSPTWRGAWWTLHRATQAWV